MRTHLKYMTVVNPTYIACVMWKDSLGLTYRYMLWDSVGETNPLPFPLYSGQPIMKNFRIEIWDVNGNDITQSISENLITSVLQGIDYRWGNDKALANSDGQVTNFACNIITPISYPSLPTMIGARWLGQDATSTNWFSAEGQNYNLNGSTNSGSPPVPVNDAQMIRNPVVKVGQYITGDLSSSPIDVENYYLMVKIPVGFSIPILINGTSKGLIIIADGGDTATIALSDDQTVTATIPWNKWIILEVIYGIDPDTLGPVASLRYFDLFAQTVYTPPNYVTTVATGGFTSLIAVGTIDQPICYIAELDIYNQYIGDDNAQALITYFYSQYQAIYALPLVFPANSSPQPN